MARQSTKAAILQAAVLEFSENGFNGTRMEHVAARAGCNKSLVYRYFGSKDGLFRAALKSKFERRSRVLDRIPGQIAEAMTIWFEETSRDRDFMRLVQREALNDDGGEVVEQEYRKDYYRKQIGLIRSLQHGGAISPKFDAPYLFLALLAIVVYPSTFPQITRLVTGKRFDSPRFRAGWNQMMAALADHISPRK